MWGLIFVGLMTGGIAGLIYLISRFYQFEWAQRVSNGKKWVRISVSAIMLLKHIVEDRRNRTS